MILISLINCIPGTKLPVKLPTKGFNEPFTVPAITAASIISPSAFEIITAGIVIVVSVPPIGIGAPSILFITITPIAPESCAFFTLSTKAQLPLLIRAIFPVALEPKELQPSVGIPASSFANIKSAVITAVIVGPKLVVGTEI